MGNLNDQSDAVIRIIASEKNWIEGNAVQQLEKTAKLEGIRLAVGMPDLHGGKGYPVGAAFLSEGWIYPALVGNDIGCGMGLWRTTLKASKIKLDKWASRLFLDEPWEGDANQWLESYGLPTGLYATSIGTIGGGNHFAELQLVEEIYNADICKALQIEKSRLYLLVHSGSRGLGHAILTKHLERFGHGGLQENSEEAGDYIASHDRSVLWARANRALIAHRFLTALRSDDENIFDLAHNTVSVKHLDGSPYWLHRKGASPADEGILVIPGSRGSYSYLVKPTPGQDENAFSLAHGAGRKWMRSDARARLSKKYKPDHFLKTEFGGRVICEDKALIYEEAPQAYKNIDIVIEDMVQAGLIQIIAILRPVLTYKTRGRL
ncbi:MAG: RNA ligase RtcB family protein [Micavibrio sp.]|nr:MAG: RNA ligase RtcB family protein [Micavibrio sp.]